MPVANPLAYAVGVLSKKREFIAALGPVTDVPAEAREHVRILDMAISLLSHPRHEMNPFV